MVVEANDLSKVEFLKGRENGFSLVIVLLFSWNLTPPQLMIQRLIKKISQFEIFILCQRNKRHGLCFVVASINSKHVFANRLTT